MVGTVSGEPISYEICTEVLCTGSGLFFPSPCPLLSGRHSEGKADPSCLFPEHSHSRDEYGRSIKLYDFLFRLLKQRMKQGTGQLHTTWPASTRVKVKSSRLYISTLGPRHLTTPFACVRYGKMYVYVQNQGRILFLGSVQSESATRHSYHSVL